MENWTASYPFIQEKIFGKASVGFSESDEHIPMVDKAVDIGWKGEGSKQRFSSFKGLLFKGFLCGSLFLQFSDCDNWQTPNSLEMLNQIRRLF